MERPRDSSIAWGVLISSVAAYDIFCPPNDTLSERLDPILERPLGRVALYTAVGATALHLTNLLPRSIDPFGRASEYLSSIKSK